MATMFVICMNLARMVVCVRGRVEQKRSLTFYVFKQTKSKCFSSSTFPKSQPRQSLFAYGTPFHALSTTSSYVLPHWNWTRAFRTWTQLISHKWLSLLYNISLKLKYLVYTLVPISRLVKSFSMKVNRILSFNLFTLNIVWGKPRRGGAPAS
jgi:hypothetical protein